MFVLKVDPGRMKTLKKSDSHRDFHYWFEPRNGGYDSAYAPPGVTGPNEEFCIRDPARVSDS